MVAPVLIVPDNHHRLSSPFSKRLVQCTQWFYVYLDPQHFVALQLLRKVMFCLQDKYKPLHYGLCIIYASEEELKHCNLFGFPNCFGGPNILRCSMCLSYLVIQYNKISDGQD
jgi:hypothetical protein